MIFWWLRSEPNLWPQCNDLRSKFFLSAFELPPCFRGQTIRKWIKQEFWSCRERACTWQHSFVWQQDRVSVGSRLRTTENKASQQEQSSQKGLKMKTKQNKTELNMKDPWMQINRVFWFLEFRISLCKNSIHDQVVAKCVLSILKHQAIELWVLPLPPQEEYKCI